MDALIYVSGYASFKLQTKVACKNCVELFLGIEFDSTYVQIINRGGLTVPSNLVLGIGKHSLNIM
jgi:hypothetical protein